MKKVIIIIGACISMLACKEKKEAGVKDNSAQDTAINNTINEQAVANPAEDSAAIRKVVVDFYNWYNANNNKLYEYKLYSGLKKADAPPYKINWNKVGIYQQFMHKEAPQLADEFFTNQKRFLQECDSAFKVDITDEVPYGFDYDWYTNSQEDVKYLLDEINKNKSWPITFSGGYAKVSIIGSYDDGTKQHETTFVTLNMKKQNGQWKIASIGND